MKERFDKLNFLKCVSCGFRSYTKDPWCNGCFDKYKRIKAAFDAKYNRDKKPEVKKTPTGPGVKK